MPFLSRSIDRIGTDAGKTNVHRNESIPKTGTLVERLSSFYATRGKHLFDAIAAFFLIIIFAPLMGIVAVLIKLTSRGSVFFSHKRVGLKTSSLSSTSFGVSMSIRRPIRRNLVR